MINKRKFLLIIPFILLLLVNFTKVEVNALYEKMPAEKKEEIVKRFGLIIATYGPLQVYKEKRIKYRSGDYYEEEQPIKFMAYIEGNHIKPVNIGRNDWYNMLKCYIELKGGEKREINYKVIEGEDLIGGILMSEEKKKVIFEIFNNGNKTFESGHTYHLSAEIILNNEINIVDSTAIKIIKAVTLEQKKDLAFRSGEMSFYEGDYIVAAKYYESIYEEDIDETFKLSILLKLSESYEKGGDYKKAKKYLNELIKYDEENIKREKNLYERLLEKKSNLIKRDGKLLTFEEYVDSVELEIKGKYLDHLDVRLDLTRGAIRTRTNVRKIHELETLIAMSESEEKKNEIEDEIKSVSLELTLYDEPVNYYGNVSKKEHYFYEDEQYKKMHLRDKPYPKIKVVLKNPNDKEISLIHNEWYKHLEFSIKPHKHLYSYDKSGKMIKKESYSKNHEYVEEEARKATYEVFQSDDLRGNKLGLGEEKSAIVKILDKDKKYFKSGYYYELSIGYKLIPGITISDWDSRVGYDIIKPVTPDQIKNWGIRKGDKHVKIMDYKGAIYYYLEVLEKEKEKIPIRKILLQKLADTYEQIKDYTNAKKYLTDLLKYVEEDIKNAKDKTKPEEEKARIQKKIKELDELIKKQGK